MRYFTTFLVISLFFYSFQIIGQDSNNVSYSLFLEKSVTTNNFNFVTNIKVDEGEFKEGKSFTIPEAELTGEFSIYQDLYNALVGGVFSIDYGALDNDIEMKIFLRNLDPQSGKYLTLGEENDTLFSYFEIRIWELPDSNFYPEKSSYYFNDGYYARFSLPKSEALLNFLTQVGINTNDSLAFAFLDDISGNDEWNGFGIETIDAADTIRFKAVHLSRIGGGRRRLAKNVIPTSIKINELKGIPTEFKLNQNYPNPFNPSTKISYTIKKDADINLSIYNVLGKQIITLVDKYQSAGNYEIEFSANEIFGDLSSGIYFYSLNNGRSTLTKKMILMK